MARFGSLAAAVAVALLPIVAGGARGDAGGAEDAAPTLRRARLPGAVWRLREHGHSARAKTPGHGHSART